MDFPAVEVTEDEGSRAWLRDTFHPSGLRCPRCEAEVGQARLFRRTKRSQLDVYRCGVCDKVFNLYTDTPFEGKHLRPLQAVSLLRGMSEGKSNPRLAVELGLNRTTVYNLRNVLVDAGVLTAVKDTVGKERRNRPRKLDGSGGNLDRNNGRKVAADR